MRIAVTSQNFRTITGHAGKTRRFLMFCVDEGGSVNECGRLDLPREMSMHAFSGDEHPVDVADVLITAGCGDGFRRRMAARGIRVVTTSESDPLTAARTVTTGAPLPPPEPEGHGGGKNINKSSSGPVRVLEGQKKSTDRGKSHV